MYARITTLHTRGGKTSADFRAAAQQVWAGVRAQPGCLGGLIMTDPVAGAFHGITFWTKAPELVASQPTSNRMVEHLARWLGANADEVVVQVLDLTLVDLSEVMPAVAGQDVVRWSPERGDDGSGPKLWEI